MRYPLAIRMKAKSCTNSGKVERERRSVVVASDHQIFRSSSIHQTQGYQLGLASRFDHRSICVMAMFRQLRRTEMGRIGSTTQKGYALARFLPRCEYPSPSVTASNFSNYYSGRFCCQLVIRTGLILVVLWEATSIGCMRASKYDMISSTLGGSELVVPRTLTSSTTGSLGRRIYFGRLGRSRGYRC
jgi:hypothetical protein